VPMELADPIGMRAHRQRGKLRVRHHRQLTFSPALAENCSACVRSRSLRRV
jgi:hypothetical protein